MGFIVWPYRMSHSLIRFLGGEMWPIIFSTVYASDHILMWITEIVWSAVLMTVAQIPLTSAHPIYSYLLLIQVVLKTIYVYM